MRRLSKYRGWSDPSVPGTQKQSSQAGRASGRIAAYIFLGGFAALIVAWFVQRGSPSTMSLGGFVPPIPDSIQGPTTIQYTVSTYASPGDGSEIVAGAKPTPGAVVDFIIQGDVATLAEKNAVTDASGIARVSLTPTREGYGRLLVRYRDPDGITGENSLYFKAVAP